MLVLAACDDATSTPTLIPTATPTLAPPPAPTATPTPSVKQELRVNLGGEPGTLDPQRASTLPEFTVIRQVFQGLLGFNEDLSLQPVVASRVPSVENGGISSDGLAYTFELRDGVTWSDGQMVTAEDFVYAIKRLLDPQVGARYGELYIVIAGGQEYNAAGEVDSAALEALRDAVAVTAPNARALRINWPGPTQRSSRR